MNNDDPSYEILRSEENINRSSLISINDNNDDNKNNNKTKL